jgi:hypothetical protein
MKLNKNLIPKQKILLEQKKRGRENTIENTSFNFSYNTMDLK